MHTKDFPDVIFFEDTSINQSLCAAAAFFVRLKEPLTTAIIAGIIGYLIVILLFSLMDI